MYFVFGYNDLLGEYVSEPDPRAYHIKGGMSLTCYPRIPPLKTPEPTTPSPQYMLMLTPVAVLITTAVIVIVKIRRRRSTY